MGLRTAGHMGIAIALRHTLVLPCLLKNLRYYSSVLYNVQSSPNISELTNSGLNYLVWIIFYIFGSRNEN